MIGRLVCGHKTLRRINVFLCSAAILVGLVVILYPSARSVLRRADLLVHGRVRHSSSCRAVHLEDAEADRPRAGLTPVQGAR